MPYHHGNLRETLIAAALTLAAERGPDAVALRRLARQVGVSPSAVYRYFVDRAALMRTAGERVVTSWSQLMAERIAGAAGGLDADAAYDRLDACGRAYIEYALANAGLFRMACALMLGTITPIGDVPHPYAQISERFDELVTTGAMTPARREHQEVAAFSAVHGYTLWMLDGPGRTMSSPEREASLTVVLSMIRHSIQ